MSDWDWDLATDRILASPDMLRLFGLDETSDPGEDAAWFERIHPDDRERLKAAEQASLAGADHVVAYRILLPDGSIRQVHEVGEVIRDAAGTPVRMLGWIRELPEYRRRGKAGSIMGPLEHRWVFTGEPTYPEPDLATREAATRWRAALSPDRLRELLESLPAPRSRLHAPEAMAATDALIEASFRSAGWQMERQELRLTDVAGGLDTEGRYTPHVYPRLEGANLVGVLEGESHEAVVIVAHHDTVRGSPGADDNGAGVVALLELARLLAGRRFRKTVVLVAPDFEEIGLVGSRELVPWLRERFDVRAAIVFDPIGYMDPRPDVQRVPPGVDRLYPGQVRRLRARRNAGDTVVTIYRRVSMPLVREWAIALSATVGRDRILLLRDPVDLPVLGRLATRVPAARNFSRSDHVPFWRAGLPAIHVTDTGEFRNPHYHRPSDTPDRLDYQTLADIVAATALVVEHLAGR